MNKKKGFTLIELLVVIAIIALLLAILMPSLKKVKQIARDVVCRSNLKQWSLIWGIYTDENDGKFPYTTDGLYPRGEWINFLRSEWETEGDIVRCPSAAKYKDTGTGDVNGSYTSPYEMDDIGSVTHKPVKEKCSYGMNAWAYSASPPDCAPSSGRFHVSDDEANFWQSINVRGNRSSIPLFMDSIWRGGAPGYSGDVDAMNMPAFESETNNWSDRGVRGGIRQFAMPRHGAGAKAGTNVLFFDLSARHVQIKEMWTLKWHRNFDTGIWQTQQGTIWPGEWMKKYSDL